jgi:hypothetical protein
MSSKKGSRSSRWRSEHESLRWLDGGDAVVFETLAVRQEGAVLFADIAAQPMNLLGPERASPR